MQGHDPREYYAAHPIKNKVEQRTLSYTLTVSGSGGAVDGDEQEKFAQAMEQIAPVAVESVTVRMPPSAYRNKSRRAAIKTMLKEWGYHQLVRFEPLEELALGEATVEVVYHAVVLPDCPDWRMSPVTSYSNHVAPNFGCASTTNLGLMVDNPKDLVAGTTDKNSNTQRSSQVLTDYRAGQEAATASPVSGGASASQ